MELHAHTLVSSVLEQHPYAEDVLAWHGVRLDDTLRDLSLYALCWIRGLELGTLIRDLEQVIAAEDDTTEELHWSDEPALEPTDRMPEVEWGWEVEAGSREERRFAAK